MTDKGVHTADDMFKYYKKIHPTTSVTESRYKKVLYACFKQIVEEMLNGNVVKLGQRLGEMGIKKVKRTYEKPVVNWFETMELRKQGIKKVVFFTDDYWYRFYWKKKSCQIPNKTVYCFQITKGPNGNRKKLVDRLKSDEFAYLLYPELK